MHSNKANNTSYFITIRPLRDEVREIRPRLFSLSMPKKTRKKRSRRSKKKNWWEKLQAGGKGKLFLSIGCIGILLIYSYFFYVFGVSPFTLKWKALYGNVSGPEGYSIRGIDISHHQGKIDWAKLSKATVGDETIDFVFIKATEGTSILDENFNDNFYQAREYGFLRGAYHFFSPSVSAKKQAEYFLKQVHLEEGDLPPVLDIESIGTLNTEEIRNAAKTWLETVEKVYKIKPIIYTNHKFKQDYLNTPTFNKYPYWIAHYYVDRLAYKGEWKFWQYTDVGQLEGVREKVDFNIYNGSMYDLKQFTIQGDKTIDE